MKSEQGVLASLPSALPVHFLVVRVDERTGALVDGKATGKARGHAFLVNAESGTLRCSVAFDRPVTADLENTVSWRQAPPDTFEGRAFHMILPSSLEAALTRAAREAIVEAFANQGLALELIP